MNFFIMMQADSFDNESLLMAKQRSDHVAKMTSAILFLGVPHRGTKAALLGSLLSCTGQWRGSSTKLLEYMSEDGPAIKALEDDFYSTYIQPRLDSELLKPYICNFIEMRPESYGRLSIGPVCEFSPGGHVNCFQDGRGTLISKRLSILTLEILTMGIQCPWIAITGA